MKKDRIQVLVITPGEYPMIKTISNTLGALQDTVGGYIETLPINGKIIMIVNEEGKLRGLPYNFDLPNDCIVGPAIFCRNGEDGEFASIENDEAMKIALAAKEGMLTQEDLII